MKQPSITFIVILLCLILVNLTDMSESLPLRLSPRFGLDRIASFGDKVVGGGRGQVGNRGQTNSNGLPDFLTTIKSGIGKIKSDVFPTQKQKYQNNVNIFMNALLQPGKKLTLEDVSDFLSIFSNVPKNQRELILEANSNFYGIRENFSKLNPNGKETVITSVMRLVKEPRLLTETQTTTQIIPSLGGVEQLAKSKNLRPTQKQTQVAKGVVDYFEKNVNTSSEESPFYFTSVLQKLNTIVNNVLSLLENEPIFIQENNQIQTLKQRIQQQKKKTLRQEGVTPQLMNETFDIQKSWEQTNNDNTFQRVMDPYGKHPLTKEDFKSVLTVDGNLNEQLVRKVNQVKQNQKKLRLLQSQQLTSRATQKYYEGKNGKSLQFLKDNKELILELLTEIGNKNGDNQKIMNIIFDNPRYKDLIYFFALLLKHLEENGTESEKKLIQEEQVQISKNAYDTFTKILQILDKVEKIKKQVASYHPIYSANYPSELLSFENILVKLEIPSDVREKILEKIKTYTRELAVFSEKARIQVKDIRSDLNEYYKIDELIQKLQTEIQKKKTQVLQTTQNLKKSAQQNLENLKSELKAQKERILEKIKEKQIEIQTLFDNFVEEKITNSQTLKNMRNEMAEKFQLVENYMKNLKEELYDRTVENIPNEMIGAKIIKNYYDKKSINKTIEEILKNIALKKYRKQQTNLLPPLPSGLLTQKRQQQRTKQQQQQQQRAKQQRTTTNKTTTTVSTKNK